MVASHCYCITKNQTQPVSHQDFNEDYNIAGFKSHMLAATRLELVPKWLSLNSFYLYTALCCTVRRFQPDIGSIPLCLSGALARSRFLRFEKGCRAI